MQQLMRASRGQTVIELLVAMPLVLFALFGIIYVSRLGVLNERAELSLRYGAIAAFATTSNEYSASNIYQNLSGGLPSCPTPPMTVFAGASPFPGPTSAPFWQPDADVPQTSQCTTGAMGFGGSQFIASHFWATTQVQVQAGIDVPKYLQGALGKSSMNASTSETFIHAAYPGIILWCSKEVRDRVEGAVTANDSATPPTPIPDGATPEPLPPNNNGSCN